MRPQFRLCIRCMRIRVPRTRKDGIHRDTCMQTLFAECESLKSGEIEFLSSAAGLILVKLVECDWIWDLLYSRIPQDNFTRSGVE